MKGKTLAQVLLARVLLPISLLAAAILRQNLISLIYFILLLVSPLIDRHKHSFDGAFRGHILVVMIYSILVVLAELVFQLYLIFYAIVHEEHYGYVLHPNGTSCHLVNTLQLVGFERVDAPPDEVYHSVRLLLPDGVMLIVSVITYAVLTKLYTTVDEADTPPVQRTSYRTGLIKKYVETCGEFSIFLLLGASAAMVPSVISFFYFLIFFGVLIYYSLHLPFNMKSYSVLKVVLYFYVCCHMILLYFCQFYFLQTWLDENVDISRLIGMTPLFVTDCERPWVIEMEDHSWPYFVNPCVLFALFTALSMDYAYQRSKRGMLSVDLTTSAETSPLSRADSNASSERQLLAHAEMPAGYGAVSADVPDAPAIADVDAADERPVRKTWNTIYNTILHNSYLLAFFAMIGWAVAYPSWTAFVFLVLGCLLWLFRDARKATLYCSPLLVFYAVCLCVLQYFCSVNFGGKDYNTSIFFNATDDYSFSTIGLNDYDYPAAVIMIKMLFTMIFCVVLRQLRRVNFSGSNTVERGVHLSSFSGSGDMRADAATADVQSVTDSNIVIIGRTVYTWISKYWLVAFYVLLLIMAIQEPFIYRLVYMVLFLFSAITFQLYYPMWRSTLLVFLIVVAIYSIIAIQLVYILSFYEVLHAFQNATHLSDDWLTDLGFDPDVNYQDGASNQLLLLSRLIVPALLLVAVMLQIHIFHGTFMGLTDPANIDRYMAHEVEPPPADETEEEKGGFVADLVKLMKKLRPQGHKMFYATCRLFTIHLYKAVYIYAVFIVTREPSAFSFVLLVILNLTLFFDPIGKFRKLCLLMAQFWIGVIILARMLFQLNSMPKDLLLANCTSNNATFQNGSIIPPDYPDTLVGEQDSSAWLGLETLIEESLPHYIGGYVLVLVGFTAVAIFRVHNYYRCKYAPTPPGVTFPSITHECLDKNLLYFIGYLINFGFIKFGLEASFICTTIVICYRQDVIGALYILLLAILIAMNICGRKHVRRVWSIYMITLALLVPLQYLSALGLPPTLCHTYPWLGSPNGNLRVWLYLPSYTSPPYVTVLFADCIQLMFVTLQFRVFQKESEEGNSIIAAAGSNKEFGSKPPASFRDMHDFVESKRNMVDVILSAVCCYWFWVCIAMLFITGTQNINLYCFGYLLSSFYFFWHGLDFIIKEKKALMRTWHIILFYNLLVILLKTWLQIVGCTFLNDLLDYTASNSPRDTKCILPELLSIKCLNPELEGNTEVCGVSQKEAGLMWDVLCFAALLLQRRIFMSTYFLVVVCEEKSQAALSSRGAELINGISAKRIAKQEEDYEKEMANIRRKLDKIRMRTSRLEGGASREDWTHFDVTRSGDASMFDEGSDDETTITDLDVEETELRDKANPIKMLVTAMDSGVESSLRQRKLEKQQYSLERGKSFDQTAETSATDHEPDATTKLEESQQGAGDGSEHSDPEKSKSPTIKDKAQSTDAWFKEFVFACIKWIINKLNEISADYRTVASQIDREQVVEKEKEREKMLASSDESSADVAEPSNTNTCEIHIEELEERWHEAFEQRSLFYRFFNALYLAFIARTEFICYFAIILCNICDGSLLSLPLALVALIWGMLSIPRPAKTFWILILTYVMAVVLIKYLFQFSFWPWTETAINSWNDPRLLFGLEDSKILECTASLMEDCTDIVGDTYYATYELLILLSVFVHRSVLKRYGLWRNETEQDEDLKRLRLASVQAGSSAELAGSQPAAGADEHDDLSSHTFASAQEGDNMEKKQSTSSVANWYRNITSGRLFMTGDYYAPMVLCDFINFLISVFFFSSFGPSANGNVQEYLETNIIPVGFLVLLLVQFVSIVIDRALYLQKSIIGKLIYTIILIVVIHVYTMFILPAMTGLPFNSNTVVQIWYFIKCIYFGLSAWQIKSGYPTGVLGNFLTTKYSYVNLVLFEAFIICPFLLELRCAMDWMWTKSSMSISTWFVMEDIFAKVFILKCMRQGEITFPAKRATNKKRPMKYGFGGFILVSLIFVIWFPLLLFSFATTIYNPNPPVKGQMTVSIGGYQDIFTVRTQANSINAVTEDNYIAFKDSLKHSSSATGFLNIYQASDVTTIIFKGESTAIWGISPPSQNDLVAQLKGNDSLSVVVTLDFTRQPQEGLTAGTISTQYFYDLKVNSTTRTSLYNQIQNSSGKAVDVTAFLPRYLVLPVSGEPRTADSLQCEPCTDTDVQSKKLPYHGLSLNLVKSTSSMEYWSVLERGNYTQQLIAESTTIMQKYPQMFFVAFSERIAPSAVSFLTGPGILGLYVGLVFVVGQFVRTLTSGGSYIIMFNELPNVDKIMKLCKDLYFVRENGELDLEEELYAKLVFLYRSPPTMIEWTKKTT